jgi:hypothetical protein
MTTVAVTLPAGVWLDGAHHREVVLRPPAGEDEAFLLELDGDAPPAARATALLGRCVALAADRTDTAPRGAPLARRLSAGDREALLLHLRRATVGERLEAVLTCPRCAAQVELETDVAALLLPPYADAGPHYRRTLPTDDGPLDALLRLPTGEDLEAAARVAARDAEAAATLLLARCTLAASRDGNALDPHALPPDAAATLSAELERLDPQAELRLGAECPDCGAPLEALVDAATFVLDELAARGRALLHEVHALALHYHWSERDILALGARRRRQYLALLGGA